MNTYVDEVQLTNILKQFYEITGLKVTVFGSHHEVLAEFPKTHCAFCAFLNQSKEGKELCENSNWQAFDICKESKKIYIYTCHAGLIEVVVPLVKHNQIIGYAMFGQITNVKNKEPIIEKTKKLSHVVNYEKAMTLLSSIKCQSPSKIKAEAKILEICSIYFIAGEMISSKNDLIIYKALDYIESHADRNFKVETLCEYLHISRTQLYILFNREKNMGVMEYIREVRVKRAIEYLKENIYSIKEIAYMTGFNDSNYFIKSFKKITGRTPKKYQKELQKNGQTVL